MNKDNVIDAGTFWLGCNYWTSHAGTGMWSDWRPEVVERDFKLLTQTGVGTLRVFPLWPDFQPIHLLRKGEGIPNEYRFGEKPLPGDKLGRAGLSREAMDKFQAFADLAHKHGLRLLPGLITGWMSGRLFVPPALEGRNVITDPVAIMWQVRFVRAFVRHFRSHPAIAAWDLGNECNCMGKAATREEAWAWSAQIAHAIRAEDPDREVISGMHSLGAEKTAVWNIEDQGELTDVLTVHPYPIFTPHCDREPLNTPRNGLHATAESTIYADVSGKPCFGEEVGTLGQMISSDKIAGEYIRGVLFSLWGHGSRGLLWWCGHDQRHLEHAPYDWNSVERELGLLRGDGSAKPVAETIGRFEKFLKGAPVLPAHRRDAVCIVTDEQDNWGVGFASFILAKQAGFDIEFQTAAQPLKKSDLYLLPAISGCAAFSRRRGIELSERVKEGATLYLSLNDGLVSDFKEWFGLEVQTRQRRPGGTATLSKAGETFTVGSPFRLNLENLGAEVLAAEPDGNPAFTRIAHGKGTIYLLTAPIESHVSLTAGSVYGPQAAPLWKFYAEISATVRKERVIAKEIAQVGITEHSRDAGYRYAVLINYGPDTVRLPLKLAAGWKVADRFYGADGAGTELTIGGNDAVVLGLAKTA